MFRVFCREVAGQGNQANGGLSRGPPRAASWPNPGPGARAGPQPGCPVYEPLASVWQDEIPRP